MLDSSRDDNNHMGLFSKLRALVVVGYITVPNI